jgi:RNA-directed DNA polymerase
MEVAVRSTTCAPTGASLRHPIEWHTINWEKAHRVVRRLQMRIVQAIQAGQKRKARALQYRLVRSFSGKALAVKRVTENQGKRTAGIDGKTWTTPEQKVAAIKTLKRKGYNPQPRRRIYIPKRNGKKRPLGIPIMKDRAMEALHLLAVDPIAETKADPNSYGFRKERSPADAMRQCSTLLSGRGSPEWVYEGDIRACFDRIKHEWLMANVPMDKSMLHKWLKAGFIEKNILKPTAAGTPQGGICSPVLANLTLDGLEAKLREKYPKASQASRKAKVNLVRFADDFIITGSSKELLESEIKPLVEEFMRERGLELSEEKTHITHIEDGFDFLGQSVRKYKGKIIIKPAQKNVETFLDKIRKVIKANKQATAGHLIVQLNPFIRGWANYHRHVSSKQTFNKIDHAIFLSLWHWAKRRHPRKSRRWIKDKYFHSIGNRNWVFSGTIMDKQGKPRLIRLFYAHRVSIKWHIKIKGEANPYDPVWELYFEQRLGVKMENNLKGRRQLLYLWQEQGGICPICKQKITQLTGWHNHHIIWRSNGGSDKAENRVLLHPNCHRQVHSQRLEVVKPRPSPGV